MCLSVAASNEQMSSFVLSVIPQNLPSTKTRTETRMSSIGHLPDLAMLSIFDNLPLLDLIHADEVCPRWRSLKPAAFRRRKILIIVHDKSDLKALESEIAPEMLDGIVHLMPHLKVIRIVQLDGSYHELLKIKYLLQQYRSQLLDLSLWFWGRPNEETAEAIRSGFKGHFASLFSTLNSMTALESLYLNLQTHTGLGTVIPLELSIAGRLKSLNVCTFCFDGQDDSDRWAFAETLQEHCEGNGNLEEIFMDNAMLLESALAYGPRVSSALKEVHLKDHIMVDNLDSFKEFASAYSNLLYLYLFLWNVSMGEVAEALAPCTQLVHLSLVADFDENNDVFAIFNQVPPEKLKSLSFEKEEAVAPNEGYYYL